MEKNKIQAIVLISLFVIAGIIWFYPRLKNSDIVPGEKAKKYELVSMEELEYIRDYFDDQKQKEAARPRLVWARDPFHLPLPAPGKATFSIEGLRLTGIAVDPGGRIAIINDEIVREEEELFGVRIVTIMKDSVIVEKDGKKFRLKIY